MKTFIIYVKGGLRNTVGYIGMNEAEALKQFRKEYGRCKILFTNTI